MRYLFTNPQRFVAGTIGQPGERAFYLQVRSENKVVSVAVEKAQVQAIVDRLELMIAEIKKANPLILIDLQPKDDAPLETPVDEEFQVGAISLAWDEEASMVSFEMYELEDDEEGSQGGALEVHLSLGMAVSFVHRSKAVVNAGRLPCPFCSIPIDQRGHLCPRANGYRR